MSGPLSSSGSTKMNQKWLVLTEEEVGEGVWPSLGSVGEDIPKEMSPFPQWLNTMKHCRKGPRLLWDRLCEEAWPGPLSLQPIPNNCVSDRTPVLPSLHHGGLAASQTFSQRQNCWYGLSFELPERILVHTYGSI